MTQAKRRNKSFSAFRYNIYHFLDTINCLYTIAASSESTMADFEVSVCLYSICSPCALTTIVNMRANQPSSSTYSCMDQARFNESEAKEKKKKGTDLETKWSTSPLSAKDESHFHRPCIIITGVHRTVILYSNRSETHEHSIILLSLHHTTNGLTILRRPR